MTLGYRPLWTFLSQLAKLISPRSVQRKHCILQDNSTGLLFFSKLCSRSRNDERLTLRVPLHVQAPQLCTTLCIQAFGVLEEGIASEHHKTLSSNSGPRLLSKRGVEQSPTTEIS